jgi:hypothetical protein
MIKEYIMIIVIATIISLSEKILKMITSYQREKERESGLKKKNSSKPFITYICYRKLK